MCQSNGETGDLSDHPSAVRTRRRCEVLRGKLIHFLGGRCKECGTEDELEPHHIVPRTWKSSEVWRTKRLRLYLEEAARGDIVLLCRSCNATIGQPDGGYF